MCQDLINHPVIPDVFKTTAQDAMDYFLLPLEKFDATNKSSVQSNQHSEQNIESLLPSEFIISFHSPFNG